MRKNNKFEKANDFSSSIKRLIKEIKPFKFLIIISFVLAICGSILTIITPKRLTKLTDTIQAGLTIDKNNIKLLNEKIALSQGQDIVIDGNIITLEDQMIYINEFQNLSSNSSVTEIYDLIDNLPESIQNVIKPKMNMETIRNICLLLMSFYLISALFSYIQSLCMTNVSNKFAMNLRDRISKKINKLPLKYFDTHQNGDILSRVTNDVDTLAQTLNNSLSSLASNITLC